MRHPHHDLLAGIVRGWYTHSAPEMGYTVERRPFGVYSRNPSAPYGHVTIRDVAPEQIPAFVADLRAYYPGRPVVVLVDDAGVDAALGPSLVAGGCARGNGEVFLAHTGPLPRPSPVAGVSVEPVTAARMAEYVATKLRGFASSEAMPDPVAVEAEAALRRAEMGGQGRFLLARVDGEPAAIIGRYAGEDSLIFQLATRVPYRNRGIARMLLGRVLTEAAAEGGRSVMINCDPLDTPITLYRRLGFTDEVYRRQRYELPAAAP